MAGEGKALLKGSDIRLTMRLPEKLDTLIRHSAKKRGTNINQMMLYILNRLIDLI